MTTNRPDPPFHPENPGFEIGWDFAHFRLIPPAGYLLSGNPVRTGWDAGQAVFGQRTLRSTPHVRKWLQLRLNAWIRGKAFELAQVTPRFLERIEVAICPVTGEPLTRSSGLDSDASVDRVNNSAGYAAGNLAVMSVRANRAKSDCDWRDAARFVRQIEAGSLGQIDGLDARQWARLATLMSYCTPLTWQEAAHLPLLILPPPRLRILSPVQCVQAGVTLCFIHPERAPRLDELLRLFPVQAKHELRSFLTTLLARRMAAGPAATGDRLKAAMETAWSEPLVIRRWQRVVLRMDPESFDKISAALPGAMSGPAPFRHLALEQATEGWALATGGMVDSGSAVDWPEAIDAPGKFRPAPANRAVPTSFRIPGTGTPLAF